MTKYFLAFGMLAILGCSGGGSGSGETRFNFDGSWTGEGSLTSKNQGMQECPAMIADLEQTETSLQVNVIKWACETVTRSTGRTIELEINDGKLFHLGQKVGTITEKKITAELKSNSTISKYEIFFDTDNKLMIYQETMNVGQDIWTVLGVLKKK